MEESKGYPVTVSAFLKAESDSAIKAFMETFEEMVSWWLERMAASGKRSYRALRARHYGEARRRWGEWNSQHVETSSALAFFIYSNKVEKKALRFAVLSPSVVSVADGKLRVSLKPRTYGYVKLFAESAQQRALLKIAEEKLCRLGQVVLFEGAVLIPFILELNLSSKEAWQIRDLLAS